MLLPPHTEDPALNIYLAELQQYLANRHGLMPDEAAAIYLTKVAFLAAFGELEEELHETRDDLQEQIDMLVASKTITVMSWQGTHWQMFTTAGGSTIVDSARHWFFSDSEVQGVTLTDETSHWTMTII